jgi:predicted RNA-binding protein with TRAM domain
MGNVISTINKDLHSGVKSPNVPGNSPGLQILGITPNSATLNWTTVDFATQYQVMYQVNGSNIWNNYTTTSKNAAVVTGLVSATTYNFSLSASNIYGVGTPSIVTGITLPNLDNNGQTPSAPSQFQVTSTSNSSVTLNWNSVESAVQYQVQYQVSGSGNTSYSWITSGVTPNLNLTVNNLTMHIPYNFTVTAINNYGVGPTANISNFQLQTSQNLTPPSSPTHFEVESNTANNVTLHWDTMSGAIQYNVMYQVVGTLDSPNAGWIEVGSTSGTICVVNNMLPGINYNFCVISVNNYGASSQSIINNYQFPTNAATGGVAPPPPGPVTGLQTSNVTSTTVNLKWNTPVVSAGAGATIQYQVLYQVAGSNTWTEYQITPNTLITVTGLNSYVTYNFSVAGLNNVGIGNSNLLTNIQLPGPTIIGNPPFPPSSFRASNIGPTNVLLTWNLVNGAVQYKILYQVASSSTGWIEFNTTSDGTLNLTGLRPLTVYNFSIIAINNYGTSTPTVLNKIQLLTANVSGIPPPSPKNLSHTAIDVSSVTLTWTGLGDSAQYIVSYQVVGAPSTNWIESGCLTDSTFKVSNLLPLSMYNFSVAAVNNYGTSEPCVIKNIQLNNQRNTGTAPSSPTNLHTGDLTSTSIALNWDPTNDTAQYLVQYQVSGTGNTPSGWYEFAVTEIPNLTITGLQPYTPYNFSVTSVNNYGISSQALLSNISTPGSNNSLSSPSIPTSFQVTNKSSSTVTLSWSAVPNTAQYQIQYQVNGSDDLWVQGVTTSKLTTTLSNLVPNILYNLSIRSVNNVGQSLPFVLKSVVLPGANGIGNPPLSPTDFQGIPSYDSVDLTWNSGVGAIQYLISYQVDGSSDWIEYQTSFREAESEVAGKGPQTSRSNSLTVESLQPLILYNFSIVGLNNYGRATNPAICQVRLLVENSGTIASSPGNIRVGNLTTNTVTLTWDPVEKAIDYIVYYQVAGSPDTTEGWCQFATTSNYDIIIDSLVSGIEYNFGVSSVNNWGSSAMSLLESIQILDPLPTGSIPIAATNMQYTNLTTDSVVLKWNPVPGATTYQILYQVDGSPTWIGWGSSVNPEVKVTGLISYVSYNFSVTVVNNYGASGPSTLNNVSVYGPSSPDVIGPAGSPPGPPSNLNNGTLNSNSVVLNWTAGLNTIRYVVSYQVSGSSSWLNFGTTANTSILVTKLLSYVNYNFSVFSINNYGISSSTTIHNLPIPGPVDSNTPPASPSNFTATNITTTSVTVTWAAPSTATPAVQYNLLYQVVGSDSWVDYGTTPNLTNTVTGLIPYLPYTFQLFAVNNYGAGSPVELKNIKMLGTGATGTIASPPSQFKVSTASLTIATLTWNPSPTAVQYNIMYQLTGISSANWVEIGVTSSTVITTPTLVPGVTYNFSVTAINNFGTSIQSLINNYRMPSSGVTGNPPTNPTALQVSNTTLTTASLGWIAPVTTGTASSAVEYNVLYQITGSNLTDWVDYTVTTATNVTINNLSPFITYTFKVIAVNDFGASLGTTIQVTLPPAAVTGDLPTTPTNLILVAKTPQSIDLSWSSSTGSVEYSLSYQITGSAASSWNQVGVTSDTKYTITSLSQMVTYNFKIHGINNAGISGPLVLKNITLPIEITGTAAATVSNLHTTSVTSDSVDLAWNSSSTAYQYNIYYQITGSSTWADFGITTNNFLKVTGLSSYVTYNFQITAINNYGNSSYTQLSGIQLLLPTNAATGTAPSPPASLTVTNTTVSTASLSWPASTTALQYNILYRIVNASSWVDYSITTNTSSVVTGLVPYVTYIFQVIAVNNYGASAPVTSLNTQLPIPSNASTGLPPNVPTGFLSSSITSSTVTLNWTAPGSGTPALQYNVLYQISGSTSWVEYNITTASTLTVTGLNPYAIYNFQVIALNNYGASSAVLLNGIQLQIPSNAATGVAATPPSNLTVSNSTSTTATLTWSVVTGANQYNVMYQLATSSTWAETTIVNSPTVTKTITGLNPYGIYNFQVISMNNYGQSSGSQILGYQLPPTTPAGTPPSSPINLVATSGVVASNSILLTWGPGSSGGAVVTYNVLYQVNTAGSWYDYLLTSNRSLNVTGLAGSATYNFQVVAINNYGSSTPATISCVAPNTTPSGSPPTAITNLSVTANSSSVTLNWTNVSSAVQYNTIYRISGTTNWTQGGTSYSSAFKVPGLVFPIVYDFQVVGVNNYGASPSSSITSGVAPAAPTNLVMGTSTTTQIPLTWSGATGATSYNLTYQIGSGAVTTLTGITSTSQTVTGLSPGTVYNISVYSVNTYGVSSNTATIISGTISPTPTGLLASSPTLTGITVNWQPTIGAVTYNLSYKPAGGSFSTLPSTNTTTLAVNSLAPGTIYSFYLTATNSYGTSSSSLTMTYSTLCPTPTGLVGSGATTSNVNLNWNSSTGATSYTIGYQTSGGSLISLSGYTATSATISSLTPGTIYNFWVYASNAYNNTPWSSSLIYGTCTVNPTGLIGSNSTTSSLNLSWSPPIGATSYTIYYQPIGGSYSNLTGITATNTTISSLSPGLVYNFYVVAVNAYGTSIASPTINYGTASSAPTGLTGSGASTSSIDINWNATTGASSYTLTYKPTGGVNTTISGLTGTSTTISSLSPGLTYNFQISAVSIYATSPASSVMAYGTITSSPTGLVASSPTTSSLVLNWNPVTGASSFSCSYKPVGGNFTIVNGLPSPNTTLVSLTPGIIYNIYIIAVNPYGDSANSSTITYGTLSPAPTGLTKTGNSPTSVNLTWNPTTGATSYTLTYQPSGGSISTLPNLTTTSTTITNLIVNTTYNFQILAINNYGTGPSSSVYTYTTTPPTPTGLTGSNSTTSSISLSWNAVLGASSYTIKYTGLPSSTITGITGTSTTITGLKISSVYNFTVTAVSGSGSSPDSTVMTYGTTCDTVPSIDGSNPELTAITISWRSVIGVTNYTLTYVPTTGGSLITINNITSLGYTIQGLPKNTTYNFNAYAVNKYGRSEPSGITWGTSPETIPYIMFATVTSTSIAIEWSAINGSTSYIVNWALNTNPSSPTISSMTVSTTTAIITGLNPNTNYFIGVQTVNSYTSGSTRYGSQSTLISAPSIPNQANVTSITNNSAMLTWSSVSTASSYNLYYTTPSGSSNFIKITGVSSPYNLNNLIGSTYDVKLTAVNVSGEGLESFVTSVTLLPETPTTLSTSNITTNSVTLTWSGVSKASTYNLYYSTPSGSSSFSKITGVSSPYNLSNLIGSTYDLKISGVNYSGEGSASSVKSVTLLPETPTTLSTSNITINSVTLIWSGVSKASTYNLYYSTPSGSSSFSKITGVSSPYNLSNLIGSTYDVKLTAVNVSGEGSASSVTLVRLLPDPGSSPTASQVGFNNVTLTWSGVSKATSYNLYYATPSGSSNFTKITCVSSPYNLTNLMGSNYDFKISGVNSGGEGLASSLTSVTLLPDSAPSPTPSQVGVNKVTLTWSGVNKAISYNLYYATPSGSTNFTKNTAVSSPYNLTNLMGSTYDFKISGVNSGGEGAASPVTSVTLLPGQASAPTITTNVQSVTLSWDDVIGASSYNLYYATPIGSSSFTTITGVSSPYNLSNLMGSSYDFKIAAVNSGGEGLLSSVTSVTMLPTATIPGTPTNFRYTDYANYKATLLWDPTPGATSYKISYIMPGVYDASYLDQATVSDTLYLMNLNPTYRYLIRLTASNSAGTGAFTTCNFP